MNSSTIIEIIGYIGSFLVLVSFLMTSVFKLRIVNTIGSFIFMCYALVIKSYPTAIMNFCLVIINLRFLWKMRHTGKEYDLVKVDALDKYLAYILKRQGEDIEKCFPGLEIRLDEANRIYLITCQGAPAGVFIGREENESIKIFLDYTLPEYRDFSVGLYLANMLRRDGIHKLSYSGPTENHMAYLNKMGFKESDGRFIKEL